MSEYDDLIVKKSKLRFKGEKRKPPRKKQKQDNQDESKDAGGYPEKIEDTQEHGGWCKVTRSEDIRDDVAIEFLPGCYARALSNGTIGLGDAHPRGDGPDEEEIFTAIRGPSNQFSLKSGFGRYLSIDPKTKVLNGLSQAIGEPELFLASFEADKAAICGFTNEFLSLVDKDGRYTIMAKADTVGQNETLNIRINQ